MTRAKFSPLLAPLFACGALGGCLVGPNYHTPSAPDAPAFKEAEGWTPAAPSDAADRKDWWTTFGDQTLDDLEGRVNVTNQTLAGDEAAYRVAHATVQQERAALYPTVTLNASATRSKSPSFTTSGGSTSTGFSTSGGTSTTYEPTVGASWAPDIWGAVRRQIESYKGAAQASAATLANARLSIQTELASDYISLRQLDEEKRIYDDTVAAYKRTLDITTNKYHAGVAALSDVLTAQSSLLSAQATDTDLIQQRAKMEHAIALLVGVPPAQLTLAPAQWNLKLPEIPTAVPSSLLQRRPDIASAERAAQQAHALIGVRIAAYYPNFTLSAEGGYESNMINNLFNASNSLWSLGATGAETLFDAGARGAQVRGARAGYDEAVAAYRQTVLTAFGEVEDNLAAQRVFVPEEAQLKAASDVANRNVTITKNEYAAGTVDFTTVANAETTALAAQNALLTIQASRLTTAVNLIEDLGGGWTTKDLPKD
jgi:NodT family efflux transporter outer membrane factor (OMF) lipoprotein